MVRVTPGIAPEAWVRAVDTGVRRAARWSAAGCLGVAALCGATVLAPTPAHAEVTYAGHAEAHGFRVIASNPAIPLGFVIEGYAPTATADLSSFGDSRALAAGPYPGTTAAALPGTVGGLFGLALPNYPVVATASAGNAPTEQNLPGLTLRADAGAARAQGLAILGSGGQGARANAVVDAGSQAATGVTADAVATVEGLALLDYLHVSRVQSRATTTLSATGTRESSSDLRIDGITAPGLTFTVPAQTPGQVPLPNPVPGTQQPPPLEFESVPIPGGGTAFAAPELGFRNGEFVVTAQSAGLTQRYPVPFGVVADAFRALGWEVVFAPERTTDTGIVGATLTFRSDLPAPPANPFGVDEATPVSLAFGAAETSVEGGALPGGAGPGIGTSGLNTDSNLTDSNLTDANLTDAAAVPGVGELPGSSLAPGVVPGDAPGTVTLGTGATGPAGVVLPGSPFTNLYGLFLGVAVATLVLAPAATFLGSRLTWRS